MQGSGIDLALLRFALQHTDSPNLANAQVKPEDYEWLREAMKSFESDTQKMQKILELLKQEDLSEEQKQASLEELQLLVEDLDNATDFVKLGGLPVTLQLIQKHTTEPLRVWALWLLATAVQNHAKVQESALSLNALEITLPLLKDQSLVVKQKALLAIIGLIKDNPQATSKFLTLDGIALLSTLFSFPDPPVRMKAAFLLARLLAANTDGTALRGLRAPEVLAPLVAMVDDPNDDAREKAAQALEIVAGDAQLREQCVAMGLIGVARDRVRAIAQEVSQGKRSQAESQEAISVLMQLLKKMEAKK